MVLDTVLVYLLLNLLLDCHTLSNCFAKASKNLVFHLLLDRCLILDLFHLRGQNRLLVIDFELLLEVLVAKLLVVDALHLVLKVFLHFLVVLHRLVCSLDGDGCSSSLSFDLLLQLLDSLVHHV